MLKTKTNKCRKATKTYEKSKLHLPKL
jgi:hypothetical protein